MSGKAINALVVGALVAALVVLGFILLGGGTSHTLRAGFDNVNQITKGQQIRIAGRDGEWKIWAPLDQLKDAWQKPLKW